MSATPGWGVHVATRPWLVCGEGGLGTWDVWVGWVEVGSGER